MMKCVTHDGDLFDPSGTLTGGSRATGASVLAKLHQLAEAEADLEARTNELNGASGACLLLLSACDSDNSSCSRASQAAHGADAVQGVREAGG